MSCTWKLSTFVCAFLLAAGGANADTSRLDLDLDLLGDVATTVSRTSQTATVTPLILPIAAQQKGGGGGGARNLPPQLSGVGLGLQVGSPTAITIKFGGVQENGIVIGIGAGFGYGRAFAASLSLHADYLFHLATLVNTGQVALTAYAGPGLWLTVFGAGYGFGYGYYYAPGFSFFGVGIRVPVGLSLSFAGAPLEIYLELDPAVFIFPGLDIGVGASLGFRWHF